VTQLIEVASEVVVLVTVTVTGSLIVDVALVIPVVVLARVKFEGGSVAVLALAATLVSVASAVDVADVVEAKLEEAHVLE